VWMLVASVKDRAMSKRSKRYVSVSRKVERGKYYSLSEGVEKLKALASAKFDESVDVALKLGINPRKSDEQVRGTVVLPHGTGRNVRIVVLAREDKWGEAKEAGADYVGESEIIEQIEQGWVDFEVLITEPGMMREVGKLGKILGPRKLMPSPKAGTVTTNLAQAVRSIKKGKVGFMSDKHGMINLCVGKSSFAQKDLVDNVGTLLTSIFKEKPSSSKGRFFRSLFLSSTMGPGVRVDIQSLHLI